MHSKFQPKVDPPMAEIQNTNAGFTLIEMLVVVLVVGIGLIGALSFFNMNINNQFEAKNELIAANLAQEGVDLARNIRDYESLAGNDWSTTVSYLDSCNRIDYRSLSGAHPCNNGNNNLICLSSGSRYQQCPGETDTGIQRTLTTTPNADGSLTVECNVIWNGRTTTARDVFYENSF